MSEENIIEFKPGQELHVLEERRDRTSICRHNALTVDFERGMVTCKNCEKEMSPLQALKILCQAIWWKENERECQIQYDLKRVSKVQTAAFLCLFEAGITPEKYAARWAKEEEKRKTVAVEIKENDIGSRRPTG